MMRATVVAGQVLVANLAATTTGDDALESAVREHSRLIYRVAYAVLRNHHDAEDATQETFIKVLKYRRKLSGVEDQRTWLARIAWRVAVEKRKRRRDLPLDEVESTLSCTATAQEVAAQKEMATLLGRLIDGLPSQLQDAIRLSTVQEMSSSDIAAVLEITEAAVRSQLFRARQLLKEKLAGILEKKHGS